MHQCILIFDCGSRFSQLIARRVRDAGVYCEIHPVERADALLAEDAPDRQLRGIILSGVDAANGLPTLPVIPEAVFEAGVPVLALGLGMAAMLQALSGTLTVHPSGDTEIHPAQWRARGHTRLLDEIEDERNAQGHGLIRVWAAAGMQVKTLPSGFIAMATDPLEHVVAVADEERRLYAMLAHPELEQMTRGRAILHRFVREICGCTGDWTMEQYAQEAIARIREQVGEEEVILGLSGGVDSSVAAALLHRAIGTQLTCVFVDHGLLRQNEAQQVLAMFADTPDMQLRHVDASAEFMRELAGVSDPETKRKIIGRVFVEIFQQEAARLPNARWLAQGTIYPDVIESARSASGDNVAVKSHHNVGGLPETLNLRLIEPLRELFKDEVRALGISLGLPPVMVQRHPFPGPGLGVRVLGEIKFEYLEKLRRADAIFIQELRETVDPIREQSWYALTSQAFAVFVPVKSVGVGPQGRRYEHVIALRAIETTDFMTARWAELPYSMLNHIATRIITEVPGVSRVVYDISGKPPATIEWE
ncbi:MAG: glutamine-hydrolyzing GMP synthase [Castellaniella sp.]